MRIKGKESMNRDRSIDVEKGIAAALMVLCHVLQFFGDPGEYPAQDVVMGAVNALAFPMFVFAYGRSVAAAWWERPWREALPRALRSALRAYAAFILSGTAYKVICQGKDFSRWAPLNVVLLRSIPGWSEFLIAFALYGLLVALALPLMKRAVERPAALAAVCLACLAATFLPYGSVKDFRLGLWIGTTRFNCFPVAQHLPFLLMGLYVGRKGWNRWLILGAAGLTGAGTFVWARFGEPGRFPPSLFWLLTPCLGIALMDLLARRLDGENPWLLRAMKPVRYMGRNSLFFLLASNLCIFALSRMGTLPLYKANEKFPFNLPAGSTLWALAWTAILLLGIGFLGSLVWREPREK